MPRGILPLGDIMERIVVTIDTSDAKQLLAVTAEFADRFPELVERLLGSHEILSKLFRIQVDSDAAAGAGHVRTRLKPTDFYRHLVAALRALDRDDLIVEKVGHLNSSS